MQEKIYGNMSACHLKLQNWHRAVETADACLKKNDGNLKALFRKGKALGEQGYWEKAEPIMRDLLKKNPAGMLMHVVCYESEKDLTSFLQRRRVSMRKWRDCRLLTKNCKRRRISG